MAIFKLALLPKKDRFSTTKKTNCYQIYLLEIQTITKQYSHLIPFTKRKEKKKTTKQK